MGKNAKSKAKFICYYLLNTGEICGRRSTRPEGCRSHFKAKMRRPCSACRRPTKLVKPTGVDNGLCSYCNKSNYQIQHVNMLRDKAQMFDLYTSEIRLRGVALKGFAYSYLFSYIERAFVIALLLLMLVLSCYLCGMLLGGNLYIISCVHAPLCSADFVNIMFALENLASEQDKSHFFEHSEFVQNFVMSRICTVQIV
ncbi:hypothetical protein GLOIN_2v1480993 [Rhizophagus irregularis DAOM 181602=DAOM 197198]|uniref:Uncharacterized protein n=1 Tax=Rhizophagus irregularis (strain DAOM 181602 / DAOM 197198 / MUCL 43194) TaxID=747089 RepID=A0A2P4PS01_RHIID|nr:hypothetical protein GLOIN_2v1480993 [Rhizophagus irregularis DAOM 181602=DAOM 197198]POG68140.1 hypothetical protein GLOIN_2v1480993 [Rhizophagus irregularis DAOM 181602=DAOM 197198]|eukprot:XP_025175006.1 hypothetical protein GLOIN_2v1480993 [Rhizophagus irregularis DAOM 181602=DAOM 197198]